MSNRIVTLLGAFAGVLVLALLAGIVGVLLTRPALAQNTSTGGTPRQVTVVGEGEVTGAPDTATVQIGVDTQGKTAQDALAANNTQAAAVIAKLKELGIAEKDIQTSNFNINATYEQNSTQINGYQVSNTVTVKISDLDKAGGLLDQVVQAGANSIRGVSFSVDDPTALYNQARDKAIAAAQTKAAQLAKASGATVGQVLVITENVGSAPVPMMLDRAAAAPASDAKVPMQAGEQSFNLQVQVTYELK